MAHWSSLKYVTTVRLVVDDHDLIDFVDWHGASLEAVTLDMLRLKSGTWKKVFTGMRGRKVLKRVVIGSLIVFDRAGSRCCFI